MKKKIQEKISHRILKMAAATSIESANVCCFFLCHQSKLPSSVEKLNKHNG